MGSFSDICGNDIIKEQFKKGIEEGAIHNE